MLIYIHTLYRVKSGLGIRKGPREGGCIQAETCWVHSIDKSIPQTIHNPSLENRMRPSEGRYEGGRPSPSIGLVTTEGVTVSLRGFFCELGGNGLVGSDIRSSWRRGEGEGEGEGRGDDCRDRTIRGRVAPSDTLYASSTRGACGCCSLSLSRARLDC